MAGPKHSCGVVAMSATYDVVPSLYKALSVIQHRGQESAGISAFNGEITETVKGNGLVSVALSDDKLKDITGHCGIGHVRYSTTGSKAAVNAQPLTVESNFGTIAIAHNGDITNFSDLKNGPTAKAMSWWRPPPGPLRSTCGARLKRYWPPATGP